MIFVQWIYLTFDYIFAPWPSNHGATTLPTELPTPTCSNCQTLSNVSSAEQVSELPVLEKRAYRS